MENTTLLLSQQEVESLLTMKDVVEICDKTFKGFGEGTTICPTKVGLDLGEKNPFPAYEGYMNAMPAYVGWKDAAGIKWAGGLADERRKAGLPYITSMIMMMHPQMGNFEGVLDGATITNWRTGAQAAIALKYLKEGQSGVKLGIYGAGMQGRTSTMAIAEVFDIDEIRVYDLYESASEKFKEDMAKFVKGDIVVVTDPQKAAEGVDAIITVTQSKEKFLKEEWVEAGTAVIPMGSYQECEDDFIRKADRIVVDHVGQCLHRGCLKELSEAGEVTEETLYGTIGDLAAGNKPGKMSDNERVLCVPIGTGAMDIAIASVVLDRAKEKKIGGSYQFV